MMHLDCPSQRWLVQCDVADCGNKILASEGTHAEQHAELARLVDAAGWRHAEYGHLCAACAVMLAPPIPRDELCRRDVLCVAGEGHAGRCLVAKKRELPQTDFGPSAARKRRWG